MKKRDVREEEVVTALIRKNHLTLLESFSHKYEPFESCAILIGKKNNNQFIVLEVIFMENEDKSEIRFTINEDKLFAVYKMAESFNLSVVGIYHTHPTKPFPSIIDIKYMEINPVPWIINSTITHEIKCYIYYEKDGIKEIELIVMD
ncbi:MAG: M67 family metallopeptidase [Nitrosopumilus sp.]|nr:M67 family metallopeptidase [Nitrosopumilus sp.]